MIFNIAFCIGVVFTILSIVFIYNQIKLINDIKLEREKIVIFRKNFIILDCAVFILSIIFFSIIYFGDIDGYELRDNKILILLMILFLVIVLFSLFNIVFLINSKRKKIHKMDNKLQLIIIFIIYSLIVFLMEMSSKYCKIVTTLLWTNYFYGYVFMYMHFLVKICFYVAIAPIIFIISNIIVKKFKNNK